MLLSFALAPSYTLNVKECDLQLNNWFGFNLILAVFVFALYLFFAKCLLDLTEWIPLYWRKSNHIETSSYSGDLYLERGVAQLENNQEQASLLGTKISVQRPGNGPGFSAIAIVPPVTMSVAGNRATKLSLALFCKICNIKDAFIGSRFPLSYFDY